MNIGQKSNDPLLSMGDASDASRVVWGSVSSISPENNTMTVVAQGDNGEKRIPNVIINNMVSPAGGGVKMMPVPNITYVILYEDVGGRFYHIGYYLEGVAGLSDNKFNTKQSTVLLQRYLEPGEVQLTGFVGNEILLANDGSVLIKNKSNSFIKLEDYTQTLEGSFANMKFEMDGTRIRSGNIIRPNALTGQDEYIVEVDDGAGTIKKESELTPEDLEIPMKEFTVTVGTLVGSDGLDDPDLSPLVGSISMASKVINEDGTEHIAAGQNTVFSMNLDNGAGLTVTEDGSFYILDNKTGNATKFGVGEDGYKSFRVGETQLNIDAQDGVVMKNDTGAKIQLDNAGNIYLIGGDGRGISIVDGVCNIDFAESNISMTGSQLNLMVANISHGSVPFEKLIAAIMFGPFYDAHVHVGPTGPVLPAMSLTLAVSAGLMVAGGFTIS